MYANVGRRTGREVGGTRVTINSPVFARLPREIIGCYMIVTPCGTSLADGIIHTGIYTVVDPPAMEADSNVFHSR